MIGFDISASPRRLFAFVQIGKALVGAVLAAGFIGLVGRPDGYETLAMAGLVAPLLLALAALTPLSLPLLEQMSLGLFAVLIGYLAALTGGLSSPLMVWLVLVPAEAALAAGQRSVAWAAGGAALVLLLLAAVQVAGFLPPPRVPLPAAGLSVVALLAALAQGALIATAARNRQCAADRAADEGEARYQLLADNAVDLITRHAPDGRIRFASPASRALLGRAPEELVGTMPAALAHPDDLSQVQAAFMESAYFGREGAAQARLLRGDKGYVWAEIRCRPMTKAKGGPAAIVAVTRDISERKAQEQALIEARDQAMSASRAKSAFLANMSHELRTPLNAIIGFSEIMNREMFGALGNARYREYSGLIHDSGGHLLELINGVLDMSKIEAGKFELHEELFELDDVAQSALRFVKLAAERGGVALTSDIAQGAKLVFADKRAVKQILVNLLSNGVKFTPRGGQVALTARPLEKGVELMVRDTGTGISKSDLEKLGKPFAQAESAATRTREGTGLGLALVKSMAAMHGGEMVLESALGLGTTARVRLPYAAAAADGTRQSSTKEIGAKVLPFRGAA